VSEDWAAVARAISQRLHELGMRQRELAERSHVSQAIVRELQHNTAQRRRSSRTLEALSAALAWHPQHLTAVLTGRTPPEPGDPPLAAEDDVPARLTAIEHQLRELTERLGELNDNLAAVLERVSR
jgi:transcriptional regulator with XRE-family HTH domain